MLSTNPSILAQLAELFINKLIKMLFVSLCCVSVRMYANYREDTNRNRCIQRLAILHA